MENDAPKSQETEEQAKVTDEKALNVDEEKGDGDEAEENEGEGDDLRKARKDSTCVRIRGFKRSGKPEEDYAAWYKFFTEKVQIEAPLLQNPAPGDQMILFKFRSLEDRNKYFEYIKTNNMISRNLKVDKSNDGMKFVVKTMALDENYQPPERLPMSIDEALDILYPKRNTLYSDQLKEKHAKVKTLVEEHLLPVSKIEKYCGTKRYIKNIKTKEVIPLSPTEGYENNVLISVEKNEAGEVIYGLRAVDATGTKTTIVPLDKCLSISRQTAIVAKSVVSGLSSSGLEPYSIHTKQGDLLGLALRFSVQATFMLTVIVRKPYTLKFHELTPNGLVPLEGDEIGDNYKGLLAKVTTDCKAKITKFFQEQGKSLGISSVFFVLAPENTLLYQPAAIVWAYMLKPEFVVGTKRILEKINSTVFRVDWDKNRHTEVLSSVISLLEPLNFNSATTLYLVSPLKEIGYFFAKKCGFVNQVGFWPSDSCANNKKQAISDGFKNIEYVDVNSKLVTPITADNSIVIWWPFPSPSIGTKVSKRKNSFFERFMELKISSMVFISYWDSQSNISKFNNNLELHQTYMEKVYSKLRINKIIPFDLEPYRDGYGLFLYFKGFIQEGIPAKNIVPIKNKAAIPPRQGAPFRKPFQPGGNFQGKGRMPYPPSRNQSFQGRGRMPFQGGMDPWDRGDRRSEWGPDETVRHVSVMDRLGPRTGPPADNTWAEMDQVAGVVENLQNMAEQMQAFFDQSQQPQAPPPPPNWSNKRKYPEDDFDRRPPREEEPNWEERRGPPPGGRGYDMDYQNVDTKRRRGDMMERPVDSTGAWGSSGNSRGNFDGPYDAPPTDWKDSKTPSWSRRETSGNFQSERGNDNPTGWRDNGRDPSSWRDDARNPSTWKDDGRNPSTWKDDGRNPSTWKDDGRNPSSWKDVGQNSSTWQDDGRNAFAWKDDSRNSSAWKDDSRNSSTWKDDSRISSAWKGDNKNTSGWKDDGRNTSGWKDDGRNTSGWKDDGRNPSGWKDDGRNPSGWKDDGRNTSGWKDDGRNTSGWKDDGRNTSGWKDDGRNTSGWKDDRRNTSASAFSHGSGNSLGWRKDSGDTDWKGGASSWPASTAAARSNPSPWEGTAGSGSAWNNTKGRSYY